MSQRPIDVIVPFYRNASLARSLFASLRAVREELQALACTVIAVNDSPDDAELKAVLREADCELIENETNQGFVRSVNAALRISVGRGHDVILLNSDTLVFPGAIAEMRRVAGLDPMIGFVSPRSNNATLCSLPHQDEYRNLPPAEAHAAFLELSRHLPDFHFVPTAVGFCLFIKFEILEEFGLLDEQYGLGYNEENDLIFRANRCGYCAVLANHAYVYHIGEASFSASKRGLDEKNAALLNARYPEYAPSVAAYFESAHYRAERMLAALLPDREGRVDIVFDFSGMGPIHNGTFHAAKQILARAAVQWRGFFRVYGMASEEARRFHRLDQIDGISFVPLETQKVFALAFRFGQPFAGEEMIRMSNAGVVNVYSMLDPIALDCLYLREPELDWLWRGVFAHADGVVYISEFVAEQFHRRFRPRPGLREKVQYLSLDLRDYAPPKTCNEAEHILVLGNAFAHKHVAPTVETLAQAFPDEKIVALGIPERFPNVKIYNGGQLPEAEMRKLLRRAKFVVYPSFYEGFGIPLLESLAYRKPILARDIPVVRELRGKLQAEDNLILFTSTRDLVRHLQEGFPVWKKDSKPHPGNGWDTAVKDLGEFFRELVRSVSFEKVLLPRLDRFADPFSGPTEPSQIRRAMQTATSLNLALKAREAEIADFRNSWSWRITAPLRAIAGLFLK